MSVDVILTTRNEADQIVEKNIGTTRVSFRTDLKGRVTELASHYFRSEFSVIRRGTTLFPFVAINKTTRECIHLQ